MKLIESQFKDCGVHCRLGMGVCFECCVLTSSGFWDRRKEMSNRVCVCVCLCVCYSSDSIGGPGGNPASRT
jgi:hypothetical protein